MGGLCLVSVMGLNEPFSHHIVDCVGCLAIKNTEEIAVLDPSKWIVA
jgi:hypothetical protein